MNSTKRFCVTLCLVLTFLCGISYADEASDDSNFDSKAQEMLLNIGVNLTEKGLYDEALVQFNKVIKINPKNADAYNDRAYVFLCQQNYQLAFWDYSKTIELDPSRSDAYYNRGMICDMAKSSPEQAILDFSMALNINPGLYEAYYSRALAYIKIREYDRSISDCNKFIEANGDSGEAYNQRAIAYYYKGDKDMALKDVEKAESLGYKVDPQFLSKISQ